MTKARAPKRAAGPASASHPERWATDAGSGDVARLDIPPDAARDRRFEVTCVFLVARRGAGEAWHALKVLVDGAHQWSRRAQTDPGSQDSLEVQFRQVVPSGRPLRLTAIGEAQGAERLRLAITAEES